MSASAEVQAWIARLEKEDQSLGRRNRVLLITLGIGVLLLLIVAGSVYRWTVGSYAQLEAVDIKRLPASQGRIEIAFDVIEPGKVRYLRVSGGHRTELIDYFSQPGRVERSWAWTYEPGEKIAVSLTSRGRLARRITKAEFPTAQSADIVILIDTTGSMDSSIDQLKEKCGRFSEQLTEQALPHRFALVGFGDRSEGAWLDVHEFTSDVAEFGGAVERIARFDGGDLPESALDALEAALDLPFEPDAMRRFYLVSDATFHEPTGSGLTAETLAERLSDQRVLLDVFGRSDGEDDFQRLLGTSGSFREIENFGRVLEEGRVLED